MADNLNESTHSSEHGEDDMIVKKLKDPDLWIRVKVTQNIKVTNIEMAQAVYASVTLNNPEVIVPNDILATQYHSDDGVWFTVLERVRTRTRTQWVSPSPSPDSSPDSDSTLVDSDSDSDSTSVDSDSSAADSDSGLMDSDSDSTQVDSDSQ